MPYTDHFKLADGLIAHLNGVVGEVGDPYISSQYTGFVSVTAVTVYELAVKEIFCEFGDNKHKVLGCFTRSFFDRLNGRVNYKNLWEDYALRFGEKYSKRFKDSVQAADKAFLISHRKSILSCYNNVITWRHSFAHEGILPNNATYQEVAESYELGKQVLGCLYNSMKR